MADPCVADTDYIALDTTGSPAVLEATLRNPETVGSSTQGDDTTHVVTDSGVNHIQARTFTIDNTLGSAPMTGVVIVALNPIWAGESDGPISLLWEASLVFAGEPTWGDQRDTITTPVATGDHVTFCPGTLVGTYTVPAGATLSVTFEKRIKNDGASAQWSFRMGGDKCVWQQGF